LSNDDYSYEINLISIALDYHNTDTEYTKADADETLNLYGTINDGIQLENAFRTICDNNQIPYTGNNYHQVGVDYSSSTVNNIYYPSKEHIITALINLKASSTDNSINIIYYSGHGFDNGSWALATTNSVTGLSIFNSNQVLSVDEIYEELEDIKGKTLIIVDACFSGNFYKESAYSLQKDKFSLINAFSKFISNDSEVSDIYILCATEDDNKSYEPGYTSGIRLHGFFTKALLEGLGWDDEDESTPGELAETIPPAAVNKIVSVDYLVEYIKANQDIALSDGDHQYPQVYGGRYDLVLFEY